MALKSKLIFAATCPALFPTRLPHPTIGLEYLRSACVGPLRLTIMPLEELLTRVVKIIF